MCNRLHRVLPLALCFSLVSCESLGDFMKGALLTTAVAADGTLAAHGIDNQAAYTRAATDTWMEEGRNNGDESEEESRQTARVMARAMQRVGPTGR